MSTGQLNQLLILWEKPHSEKKMESGGGQPVTSNQLFSHKDLHKVIMIIRFICGHTQQNLLQKTANWPLKEINKNALCINLNDESGLFLPSKQLSGRRKTIHEVLSNFTNYFGLEVFSKHSCMHSHKCVQISA